MNIELPVKSKMHFKKMQFKNASEILREKEIFENLREFNFRLYNHWYNYSFKSRQKQKEKLFKIFFLLNKLINILLKKKKIHKLERESFKLVVLKPRVTN